MTGTQGFSDHKHLRDSIIGRNTTGTGTGGLQGEEYLLDSGVGKINMGETSLRRGKVKEVPFKKRRGFGGISLTLTELLGGK